MKPSASRIERMLAKVEARLVPPSREWLRVISDDIDDEAVVKEKKEKALAEHVARHPEDAGRTVKDFRWILVEFIRSWPMPGTQEWRDAWEAGRHPLQLRRAFMASGAEVLNSTDIYDWAHGRRRFGRRKSMPFGVYSRTLRTLRAMCEPVGRAPTIGRPWLWRLRNSHEDTR